jgi:hypothetical protein
VVKARPNTFSPNRPGEPLTPDEWLVHVTKEFSFLFKSSGGGGANPKPGSGVPSGAKELRDPTPQQLGAHAADIKAGTMKVVYSNS